MAGQEIGVGCGDRPLGRGCNQDCAEGEDFVDGVGEAVEEFVILPSPHDEPPVCKSCRAMGDGLVCHVAGFIPRRVDFDGGLVPGTPGKTLESHPDRLAVVDDLAADIGVFPDARHHLVLKTRMAVGGGDWIDVDSVDVRRMGVWTDLVDCAARRFVEECRPGIVDILEEAVVSVDAPGGGFPAPGRFVDDIPCRQRRMVQRMLVLLDDSLDGLAFGVKTALLRKEWRGNRHHPHQPVVRDYVKQRKLRH